MRYFRHPLMLGLLLASVLIVTAGAAARTIRVTGREFAFGMPSSLHAGSYTFNFANIGRQPHELVLVKLVPGKTIKDVLKVVNGPQQAGPPPGLIVGDKPVGETMAQPGKSSAFPVTLTPGTYVAVCFIPDPRTHKPHAALGMIHSLRVSSSAPATLPDTGGSDWTPLGAWLVLLATGAAGGGWLLRRRAMHT